MHWKILGVRVRWWSFRGWICHTTKYQLCQISWGALDPSLSSMSAITSSNFFLQYLGSEYPVLTLTRMSTPSLHIFSVKASLQSRLLITMAMWQLTSLFLLFWVFLHSLALLKSLDISGNSIVELPLELGFATSLVRSATQALFESPLCTNF